MASFTTKAMKEMKKASKSNPTKSQNMKATSSRVAVKKMASKKAVPAKMKQKVVKKSAGIKASSSSKTKQKANMQGASATKKPASAKKSANKKSMKGQSGGKHQAKNSSESVVMKKSVQKKKPPMKKMQAMKKNAAKKPAMKKARSTTSAEPTAHAPSHKPVERALELHLFSGEVRKFSIAKEFPYFEVTVEQVKQFLAKNFDTKELGVPGMFKLFRPAQQQSTAKQVIPAHEITSGAQAQETTAVSTSTTLVPDAEKDNVATSNHLLSGINVQEHSSQEDRLSSEDEPLLVHPDLDSDPLDDKVILFSAAPSAPPFKELRKILQEEKLEKEHKRVESAGDRDEDHIVAPEEGTVQLCVAVTPGFSAARLKEFLSTTSSELGEEILEEDGDARLQAMEEQLQQKNQKFCLPSLLQDVIRQAPIHKYIVK